MRIYFDTSFLVSLYARDANFSKAVGAVPASAVKVLSQFGELEFSNALRLRVFRKQLSNDDAKLLQRYFKQDLDDRVFEYHAFHPVWLERAMLLSTQHTAALGTRTLDLLHVACALELQAAAIFTFDDLQRALAKTVGLKTN